MADGVVPGGWNEKGTGVQAKRGKEKAEGYRPKAEGEKAKGKTEKGAKERRLDEAQHHPGRNTDLANHGRMRIRKYREALDMSFTVAEFHDLVRLVEERPEWRAELRRLVLTEELLALPEQVAHLRRDTEQGFQQLATAQARTEDELTLVC